MQIRKRFEQSSMKFSIGDFEPTLAKQAPAAACDINSIMKRYHATGFLPPNRGEGRYGDVSMLSGADFATAVAMVDVVRQSFADLPSQVRDRFSNDPQAFLDFLGDVSNRDEAVEMGLIEVPPVAVVVSPVEVVK